MSNIERCWIWTARDAASGQVTRGVMFHEPEASRERLESVEEYVRADLHLGAVDALVEIKAKMDRIVAGEFGGLDVAREISILARQAIDRARGQ